MNIMQRMGKLKNSKSCMLSLRDRFPIVIGRYK